MDGCWDWSPGRQNRGQVYNCDIWPADRPANSKMVYSATPRRVNGTYAWVLISVFGCWARRWINHGACDAWPVRRQTYGYLPSLRRYQIYIDTVAQNKLHLQRLTRIADSWAPTLERSKARVLFYWCFFFFFFSGRNFLTSLNQISRNFSRWSRIQKKHHIDDCWLYILYVR